MATNSTRENHNQGILSRDESLPLLSNMPLSPALLSLERLTLKTSSVGWFESTSRSSYAAYKYLITRCKSYHRSSIHSISHTTMPVSNGSPTVDPSHKLDLIMESDSFCVVLAARVLQITLTILICVIILLFKYVPMLWGFVVGVVGSGSVDLLLQNQPSLPSFSINDVMSANGPPVAVTTIEGISPISAPRDRNGARDKKQLVISEILRVRKKRRFGIKRFKQRVWERYVDKNQEELLRRCAQAEARAVNAEDRMELLKANFQELFVARIELQSRLDSQLEDELEDESSEDTAATETFVALESYSDQGIEDDIEDDNSQDTEATESWCAPESYSTPRIEHESSEDAVTGVTEPYIALEAKFDQGIEELEPKGFEDTLAKPLFALESNCDQGVEDFDRRAFEVIITEPFLASESEWNQEIEELEHDGFEDTDVVEPLYALEFHRDQRIEGIEHNNFEVTKATESLSTVAFNCNQRFEDELEDEDDNEDFEDTEAVEPFFSLHFNCDQRIERLERKGFEDIEITQPLFTLESSSDQQIENFEDIVSSVQDALFVAEGEVDDEVDLEERRRGMDALRTSMLKKENWLEVEYLELVQKYEQMEEELERQEGRAVVLAEQHNTLKAQSEQYIEELKKLRGSVGQLEGKNAELQWELGIKQAETLFLTSRLEMYKKEKLNEGDLHSKDCPATGRNELPDIISPPSPTGSCFSNDSHVPADTDEETENTSDPAQVSGSGLATLDSDNSVLNRVEEIDATSDFVPGTSMATLNNSDCSAYSMGLCLPPNRAAPSNGKSVEWATALTRVRTISSREVEFVYLTNIVPVRAKRARQYGSTGVKPALMIPNQQDRVSWLSLEADKLVNEVRTVREELFATQKQCTAAESQYEELQKKHRVVENDLKEMTTKAEDLDRTVTEAAFLCISQGEELDELKQRCAGLEEKTGRCSCRIAGLDVVNEGAGVNAPLCSPVTEDGVFNTTRPKTLGLQDVMEWSMSASPAYLDISSILSDIADEGSAAVTCSLALESQFAFQIAVDSPLGRLRSGTTPADCRGATWAPSGRRIVQHSRAPFPIPALRPAWPIEYRDPRSEEYGKARVTKRRRTVQVAGQPEGKEEDDVGEKVSWVHRTRARRARSVRRL